jgi:hypothetical protein
MATRIPSRANKVANALAAGPPPKMATDLIFPCEWQLQLMMAVINRAAMMAANSDCFQVCLLLNAVCFPSLRVEDYGSAELRL